MIKNAPIWFDVNDVANVKCLLFDGQILYISGFRGRVKKGCGDCNPLWLENFTKKGHFYHFRSAIPQPLLKQIKEQSYAWLPGKCDYRTDRRINGQTEAGESDPYVPLCFTGNTKKSWEVATPLPPPPFKNFYICLSYDILICNVRQYYLLNKPLKILACTKLSEGIRDFLVIL